MEPRFPNRSLFPESRFLTNMFYHLPGSGCPGVLWTHSCHHHTLLADSFHLNLYLELIHDWPPIFHFSGGANDHGIVWYIPRILLKFYQFEALGWITNFCISDLLKMLDTHTIQREMKTQGVGTQWQTLKKKRKLFGFFFLRCKEFFDNKFTPFGTSILTFWSNCVTIFTLLCTNAFWWHLFILSFNGSFHGFSWYHPTPKIRTVLTLSQLINSYHDPYKCEPISSSRL